MSIQLRLWKWEMTTKGGYKTGIAFDKSCDDVAKLLDRALNQSNQTEASYNIQELDMGESFHIIYSDNKKQEEKENMEEINKDQEIKSPLLSGLSEDEKNRAYLAMLYPLVSWDNTSMIFADSADEAIKKIRDDNIYEQLGGEWIENVDTKCISPANQMTLIHIQSKRRYALQPNDFMPRNFKDDMKYNLKQIAMLEKGVPIICLVQDPVSVGAEPGTGDVKLEISLDMLVQKYRNIKTMAQYTGGYPADMWKLVPIVTQCSYDGKIYLYEANISKIYICIDAYEKVDVNNYNFIYAETDEHAMTLYKDILHKKHGGSATIMFNTINMMDALPLISECSVYSPAKCEKN